MFIIYVEILLRKSLILLAYTLHSIISESDFDEIIRYIDLATIFDEIYVNILTENKCINIEEKHKYMKNYKIIKYEFCNYEIRYCKLLLKK